MNIDEVTFITEHNFIVYSITTHDRSNYAQEVSLQSIRTLILKVLLLLYNNETFVNKMNFSVPFILLRSDLQYMNKQ